MALKIKIKTRTHHDPAVKTLRVYGDDNIAADAFQSLAATDDKTIHVCRYMLRLTVLLPFSDFSARQLV